MKRIFIVFLVLFSFNLYSQIDTSKVQEFEEVVITAQYTPQSETNAIYKVKVINAQEIENKGANNLRELLLHELNIDLSQSSFIGTSIEMQGLSKENIKILIDGVPVIGRLKGVIDLNQINLENIERIELIEGPVSVFYGTDAMGGIINLITKKNQKNKIAGSLFGYYEDVEAFRAGINLGFKKGKNTLKIGGGNYHFYGVSTIDSVRNVNWAQRNQYFANIMYNREFGKLNLTFKSDFSNEELNSLGDPDRHGKIQDTDYFTQRFNNSLNLRGSILDNKYINVTASYLDYQRYHNTYNIDPISWSSTASETDNKETSMVTFNYTGVQAQLGKNENSKKINYAVGLDLNQESTTGERILDNKKTIETYALFGSLNYKIKNKIELQPSARYTYNSAYGALISPAFNAKYRINNNSQIRFSYGRGFRAPSLKELYLDFHINQGPMTFVISGNENLDVEKSHSFNLQYNYSKQIDSKKKIDINPSVYYNEISNLITLSDMVMFHRHYINIEKFKSIGGKIDVGFNPINSLTTRVGFNYIGRYNKFKENYGKEEFLFSPEITSSIQYTLLKQKLDFNLYYKFSGQRLGYTIEENTENVIQTTRASFSNLDASVAKKIKNDKIQISLGVKNIFDVTNIETRNEIGEAHTSDMQLWGRSFYVKARINF